HPEYIVDFVETPQGDGPFGARGLGEQGIIGMPGALSAAFSRAAGVQLNALPITPEYVWESYHSGRDAAWSEDPTGAASTAGDASTADGASTTGGGSAAAGGASTTGDAGKGAQ
ncbi:MAG: hypothetical protein R6U25_01940, partial [Alkalispirochaeta sp.]